MAYYIPLLIVIIGNTLYQIFAKSVPEEANAFLSLTITYLVGAVVCFIIFFFGQHDAVAIEASKINWTAFALGIAVAAIEGGTLLMYKVGWPINTAAIAASCCVAIILVFVGAALFSEAITWNKVAGIAVCIAGVVLLNLK